MTDTVTAAIVGGIAGIVTGSISSLLAPWANWGVEKRRLLRESRKEIIHNARRMVVAHRRGLQTSLSERPLGQSLVQNSAWVRIKPFLDDEVWQKLDAASKLPIRSNEALHALALLEEDINRLEASWKLV